METKTVYHGTKFLFEKFDYSKIGSNGTNEGIGFYFTDKLNIAQIYTEKNGYIYEIEFKGKKSLSITKKTITRNQLKKLYIALGDLYLSNFGEIEFEGIEKLANEAVKVDFESSESDVDLICGLLHGCNHYKQVLETLQKILGYDSIIIDSPTWGDDQIIYVALLESAYEIKKVTYVTL